jgi:outer membrane murein-binding lipoprotein Lpp
MRKSVKSIIAVALAALAVIGCAKQSELDKVSSRLDGIENRVGVLEEAVKQLNEKDIPGLQALVRAIQDNITVTAVVETESGYVISFSDGTTATLRNGKDGQNGRDGVDGIDGINGTNGTDGKDGKDGKDGVDGQTPVIGITLVDGVYVWTVNGAILKDDAGKPIPVTGNNGKDGEDGEDGVDGITPQFGILDGHWVVSYDNGDTWKTLGLTSDTDYSAYIDPDKETDDYIVLVVGATEVQIPKEKAFTLTFTTIENNGVKAGQTASFPYTIAGVNASDETDVDVIGIVGDWTAEVVPADNASGVLKVTATESETAKVTVYAANHKGKADIRTLKFEGGVLEAIIETHDIEWEGGELALTVKTNMAYDVYIPNSAKSWITVAPTRVREDNLTITVAKNETGAYRTATLEVLDQDYNTVKEIEILQYANPEAATDLASVVALPDDKPVQVNAVTVVAASKASTIVTDGENFSYVAGYTGKPGTVIDVTGTKKTDDLGLGYVEATEVKENAEATPAEVNKKDSYYYYGFGANGFTYFYTANNGYVSENEGVYYVTALEEPQQFVIENPTQDLSALVGKFVAMSGWVKAVDYEYGVKEDIVTVLTDVREIVLAEETGWKPYYGGTTTVEPGYPELIGNEVSNPTEGSYYMLSVFPEATVAEYSSMEEFVAAATYNTSDGFLFDLTYYGMNGYPYDVVFSEFLHTESAKEYYRDFGYGKFYILATGMDAEGRLSGKYAVTSFEKESPYAKAAYEDFLGEWTYTSASGSEVWTIKEKENGSTYTIEGISKTQPVGGVYPEAVYDAENGSFTLSCQALGEFDYSGYHIVDHLTAVWYNAAGKHNDNADYMLDPLIATAYLCKDGSVEVVPSNDNWGPLEGMAYIGYIPEDEELHLNYSNSTKLPGTLSKGTQEMDPNYAKWLGTWTVDDVTLTISEKSMNQTYNVSGFEGWDFETRFKDGKMEFFDQVVYTEGTYQVTMLGLDDDGEGYIVYGDQNNGGLLATATLNEAGTSASLVGAEFDAVYSGQSYHERIVQLLMLLVDTSSGKVYDLTDDPKAIEMPTTMVKAASSSVKPASSAAPTSVKGTGVLYTGRVKALRNLEIRPVSKATKPAAKQNAPKSARKSGNSIEKAVKF